MVSMLVRNLKNSPVFCSATAQVIGRVERGVIGDDFTLAYVIVELAEGEMKLISPRDIKLSDEALVIESVDGMKSYLYGEELSICSKKIGDRIYDLQGQELGIVSDFVITGEPPETRYIRYRVLESWKNTGAVALGEIEFFFVD